MQVLNSLSQSTPTQRADISVWKERASRWCPLLAHTPYTLHTLTLYTPYLPAGCMEGHPANVIQVAVCDEHCLLKHRRLRAAPDVERHFASWQYQAGFLASNGHARYVKAAEVQRLRTRVSRQLRLLLLVLLCCAGRGSTSCCW